MPILSICIPTRNRSVYLDNTLTQLTKEDVFVNTNDVEIVISDNCSTDDTEDVCLRYKDKFNKKITYFRHKENILDKNFAFVLGLAHGKYAKLNNDNLFFKPGELEKFVSFLKKKSTQDIVFLPNNKIGQEPYVCHNFNELIDKVSFLITWIGGFCVNSKIFKNLRDPDRYASLNFSQVDIIARLMRNNAKISVYPNLVLEQVCLSNKGGYSIPKVFGHNYLTIIKEIYEQGDISLRIYQKHKKVLLLNHINVFSFNQNGTCFSCEGYFKYLLPYYWNNLYFYKDYISNVLRNFFRNVINMKKRKKEKRRKKKLKNNPIQYNCPREKVKVGRYTYGVINAQMGENRSEKLVIGDFCSIEHNVQFIVSADHSYQGLSTYPFRVRFGNLNAEATSQGDIVVKDDVLIGWGAIIYSGVTINQGAIIKPGSVVIEDVPPYAIVCGNPAKITNYRFSKEIIEKLVKFDFSQLTEEKIKELDGALNKNITNENVNKLLQEFSLNV